MSKCIISITNEKFDLIANVGNEFGDAFLSEDHAFDYLVSLDAKGDIYFIIEDENIDSSNYFLLTKKGYKFPIFFDKLENEFNAEIFAKKSDFADDSFFFATL